MSYTTLAVRKDPATRKTITIRRMISLRLRSRRLTSSSVWTEYFKMYFIKLHNLFTFRDWFSDQERVHRLFFTFHWFPIEGEAHWRRDPVFIRGHHHELWVMLSFKNHSELMLLTYVPHYILIDGRSGFCCMCLNTDWPAQRISRVCLTCHRREVVSQKGVKIIDVKCLMFSLWSTRKLWWFKRIREQFYLICSFFSRFFWLKMRTIISSVSW